MHVETDFNDCYECNGKLHILLVPNNVSLYYVNNTE